MIKKGIIRGFSALVDYELIENSIKAYFQIKADDSLMEDVAKKIARQSQIITSYRVIGEYDIMCEGLFASMKELQGFIDNELKMEGILKSNVHLVMGTYKSCPWIGI